MVPAIRRPLPGSGNAPLPPLPHSRANKLFRQPATRSTQGRADVRGCIAADRRPALAKWVAQSHSQGFGPVHVRYVIRDNQGVHV